MRSTGVQASSIESYSGSDTTPRNRAASKASSRRTRVFGSKESERCSHAHFCLILAGQCQAKFVLCDLHREQACRRCSVQESGVRESACGDLPRIRTVCTPACAKGASCIRGGIRSLLVLDSEITGGRTSRIRSVGGKGVHARRKKKTITGVKVPSVTPRPNDSFSLLECEGPALLSTTPGPNETFLQLGCESDNAMPGPTKPFRNQDDRGRFKNLLWPTDRARWSAVASPVAKA